MTDRSREHAGELRSYCVGFGLALVLSAIPFALVAWSGLATMTLLWSIGVCALIQVVAHFRCFLHIDLSKQKREDLQLILFSVLILAIMAGGTLWILHNLDMRMM